MFSSREFYKEINKRNKKTFIEIIEEKIKKENEKSSGVNIPEFLTANETYKEFQKQGLLDKYGYLKKIEI